MYTYEHVYIYMVFSLYIISSFTSSCAHDTDLLCPFGKTLNLCNRECVEVCNSDPVCPANCTSPPCDTCEAGCFCDSGLVEFGDICVESGDCLDVNPGTFCSQIVGLIVVSWCVIVALDHKLQYYKMDCPEYGPRVFQS